MICCLPSHDRMCSNCWKLQKKRRSKKTKINKKEEEKNPWCCRRKISYWPCSLHSVCDIQQQIYEHIYVRLEKNISIYLSIIILYQLFDSNCIVTITIAKIIQAGAASSKGGRSWQAFGEKKCLKFFRRECICWFTTNKLCFDLCVLPKYGRFI